MTSLFIHPKRYFEICIKINKIIKRTVPHVLKMPKREMRRVSIASIESL